MGNSPSTNAARANAPSPASTGQASSISASSKGQHRLPRHLPSQRSAAPPAPSLDQARGSNVGHRTRDSLSRPGPVAHLESHSSPHTPSAGAADSILSSQAILSGLQKTEIREEPTKPVAVPAQTLHSDSTSLGHDSSQFSDIEPSAPPQDMSFNLSRPPRLPLPIEQEVHTPGSPITAPSDANAPIIEAEILESLPRQSSNVSNTTIDEDEDAEELPVDKSKAVVPTLLEWLRGGDKVYVTGTIFQWSKKHRLHPIEKRPGVSAATINVSPGTHHVRFIVDGNMTISPDLPTTVDFGNNLVNYIEVSADDVPAPVTQASQALDAPTRHSDTKQQVLPPSHTESTRNSVERPSKPAPRTKPMLPKSRYTSQIPQYLLDLDQPAETEAYQRAADAIEKLPSPPSLPGFLGKPILNAATPMKDDNSVLNMPNHTVLNHLATSSIKNNVIAVSGTTRYKKKYVTTIMYKPTTDDST